MSWWCSASTAPWSWSPKAYVGVWLMVVAVLVAYFRSVSRRDREGRPSATRRQRTQFVAGVLVLWLASDWPLGTLGAGYMASAHMVQYLLYTMAAVPLMMLGIPQAMASDAIDRLRLRSVTGFFSRPLAAAVTFNVVMVTTHSPPVTDTLRATQWGSLVMDAIWVLGALALWAPVINPIADQRSQSYPVRMTYLFLAVGVVVVIPSAALIIGAEPIYRTFELAPRVFPGWSAVEDQQFAGVIMKLGATPIVWGAILVMFVRWANVSGGWSNKFGPKYRGRLVHADGTVDDAVDVTGPDVQPDRAPGGARQAVAAGLRPEQLN